MNIVFVIATNTSGGAERVISILCNYFVEIGECVTLINFDKESDFYKIDNRVKTIKLAQKHSDIETCKSRIYRQFKILSYLIRELKQIHPDVIIPFLFNSELPTILASRWLHIPCITSVRNSPEVYPKYQRSFRRFFYPRLAGIVLQSQAVLNHPDFKRVCNKTVIMNPLSFEIKHRNNDRIPGKIISVGRLNKQKNHELTIRAVCELKTEFPEIELHIFGTGELENELNKVAQEYSVGNCIVFHGAVPNAIEKNQDAQLFVMASDFEGFPNALVEAMACHIPVVSTDFDTGVARELIGNDENGYLIEIRNKEQLKNKLRYALTNLSETEKKADKASDICEKLDYKVIGQQWKSFIIDSIGK